MICRIIQLTSGKPEVHTFTTHGDLWTFVNAQFDPFYVRDEAGMKFLFNESGDPLAVAQLGEAQ
jgi:hypothetical protein